MATANLPPPPNANEDMNDYSWRDWFRFLRDYLVKVGAISWQIINFTGSSIKDIIDRKHNDLQSIQGGSTNEHYHLSSAQSDIINKMTWNVDDGTINLAMNTSGVVSQQIGLETYYRVINQTGSSIADGAPVMYNGTVGASGLIKIALSDGSGAYPSEVILGLATEAIPNGSAGYVTSFGKVRGINTTGSSVGETWADGDILYIHPTTAGAMTKTQPTAPKLKFPIAIVVNAHTNGTLFVRPTYFPSLAQLQNVSNTSLVDKQVLVYNSGTAIWENKDIATATSGTGLTLKTTQYLSIVINGTTYKIALVN